MATIKAFPCIHPKRELAEQVAALPYDVYNRKEAAEAVQGKPYSFLNIDRPETQYPADQDMYAPEVYQKAHDMLWQQVEDGVYLDEATPYYYLYELTMNGRSQTGLVACASIDDYCNGVIKKHENTREEKEIDRIHHVDACEAQTGPIFLTYRHIEVIRRITERVKSDTPIFDFVSEDGIGHRGWCVSDETDIEQIEQAFAKMDEIYIADGHHRAASAVKVGMKRREAKGSYDGTEEFNYFLSVLFPDDELMIMDYNRVVKDLYGQTEEAFMEQVKKICDVQETEERCQPVQKGEVGMYLGRKWYRLTLKSEYSSKDPVAGLDVSILQNEILEPYLHIINPKTCTRIDYIGGIRGLEELERRVHADCAVAFAMYPTAIEELFAVADAGLLMPPKSTWFEPKLRSGLFIHKIR